MSEDSEKIAELRKEIRDERMRVDTIIKQHSDLQRKFNEDISKWQLGIERAIGRIEGKIESLTPPPSDKTGQTEIDNAS